jgi:hypothetical protein
MTANKDFVLSLAASIPVEAVSIPGVAEPISVRGLTAGERDAFEAACFVGKGANREMNFVNLRARLLVRCICDASGKRLFADADVEQVAGLPAKVVDPLFEVAQRLSGMGAKDVEALSGN